MIIIDSLISTTLKNELIAFTSGEAQLKLSYLWQSAKSFSANELAKELRVHEYIFPKIKEVGDIIKALMLSPKNQQHFSYMIDYYKRGTGTIPAKIIIER